MNAINRVASPSRATCWNFGWSLLLLACTTRIGVSDSRAQGTIYTDRSAFSAALQSSTTVTFQSLMPSTGFDQGVSTLMVSGLSITNLEHQLFVTSPAPGGLYPRPGDGQYVWNRGSSSPMEITLPGGQNAFSGDFSAGIGTNSVSATLTITLLNGQTYVHDLPSQGLWTFQGFVYPQPIAHLSYLAGRRGRGLPTMLDNVTFGIVVPEPRIHSITIGGILAWFSVRCFFQGAKCHR